MNTPPKTFKNQASSAQGVTLMFLADSGLNDPFAPLAWVFGGIPFILGVGLLFVGLAVNKYKAKRESTDPQNQ
ncbi:MAG: hypothetical protein QNK92_04430 [Amylibacter sp.]